MNLPFLILSLLIITSCSANKTAQYDKKIELLEVPPRMSIIKKSEGISSLSNESNIKIKKKGIGELNVSFVQTNKIPLLTIKKTFDRSWEILEQSLRSNNIKITDKDRDHGTFYITYTSEQKQSNNASFMGKISSFFFSENQTESDYQLTVIWQETDTHITSKLVTAEENDLLDDGEESDEIPPVDQSTILLKALYNTIKDDLVIN